MPVRYQESPEVSAEYLRLVLPLIAQHGVPCNPVNYAVWYEYVAESNSQLKDEMDSLLKEEQALTNELCETLYRKYISEPDSEVLRHLQDEMKRLMGDVYGSVEAVGEQADRFDRSLRDYGDRLERAPNPAGLRKIVGGILSRVDVMQEANGVLRRHLQDSARQVKDLQRELERTRHEALTDPLTGLANRKAFDRALQDALQSSQADRLCLALLDIDHFKGFNDTYGHLLGDKVLRLVGAVLRQSIKGKDLAARFGGEEFAIILPDTPLKGAISLADQIRRAVESGRVRRVDNGETVGRVTISAGVAGWRRGEGASSLIARADAALYHCKEHGRNRVHSQEAMERQANGPAISCP